MVKEKIKKELTVDQMMEQQDREIQELKARVFRAEKKLEEIQKR